MSENMKRIPERCEIPEEEKWDLSSLFPSDEAWAEALGEYEKMSGKMLSFKGTLGRSAENLADWADFSKDQNILGQRLWVYTRARLSEDNRCNKARAMSDKTYGVLARGQAASAWAVPEILAIPEADIALFLDHHRVADYRAYIERVIRFRPYILSEAEERIAMLYEECTGTFSSVHSAFINVDIKADLGTVDAPEGTIELKNDTEWHKLLESPDRDLRRKVYEKSRDHRESFAVTLAGFTAGKFKLGTIDARVRGYPSARAAELFRDDISEEVYDNLIATVGENLDAAHRYHDLRKRVLGLDELRPWDMSVPLVPSVKRRTPWNEAVGLLSDALSPLGNEYASTMHAGLTGRWVDRCTNVGKSNYIFCMSSYGSDPCIMMPYDDGRIEDIIGLAHESGHAMHNLYGSRSNSFQNCYISLFEAETASAFHVEMLFRHMMKTLGGDRELRLYLINNHVKYLTNMLYGSVRKAEFDHVVQGLDEKGIPLTVDVLRTEERRLQVKYLGLEYVPDNPVGLYDTARRFSFAGPFGSYVYATGICASIALANRVLDGGESERTDYINFLKSGGSRFPMDSLKLAGVDMSTPEPIQAACNVFSGLVDELERLL